MISLAFNRIFIVLVCMFLNGCPVTVKMTITNDTKSKITMIYPTGYESMIEPGKTKEEVYDFDCLFIKRDGVLYKFSSERPPENYFDVGVFSSKIYALFTKNNEVELYRKNDGGNILDRITLKREQIKGAANLICGSNNQ